MAHKKIDGWGFFPQDTPLTDTVYQSVQINPPSESRRVFAFLGSSFASGMLFAALVLPTSGQHKEELL